MENPMNETASYLRVEDKPNPLLKNGNLIIGAYDLRVDDVFIKLGVQYKVQMVTKEYIWVRLLSQKGWTRVPQQNSHYIGAKSRERVELVINQYEP